MTTEFENIAYKTSDEFDSIFNAMCHSQKQIAVGFLNVMDSVVDYYIKRKSEGDEICYPIIYLPQIPQWAREILLKFLILKLSLYYNDDTRTMLSQQHQPKVLYNNDKKYIEYRKNCRQYLREVLKGVTDNYLGETGHKNMIVCSETDIRVSREDKNPFIQEFYGKPDDIFTEKNLIMNYSLDYDGVKLQLKKYRNEKHTSIDNVFLFYTNNDKCNSYEQSSLNLWNTAYNVGIKNCFVFYFSNNPFRLNYIWRKGKLLCSNFLAMTDKDFANYPHFVVFDESETNYLFNRTNTYEHKYFPDDQLMFKDVLGSLLDSAEYRIQERNKFALCLNAELSAYFKQYLTKTYGDYDEDSFQFSFEWQKEKVEGEILPFIKRVVAERAKKNRIAIVVDKCTDDNNRKALLSLFQSFLVSPPRFSAIIPLIRQGI